MDLELIQFGKATIPVIPKSNLSFRIHKDIENLNISHKCLLNNIWNARSDVKKIASSNALSHYFKQIKD